MASQPYLGAIFMFAGNFAPSGYQMCNGQILPISQYTALFAILGTTYGGNGTTNFALPDLRSRVPLHQGGGLGLSTYVLGESTGTENVTLLASQMPQHNHLVSVANSPGNTSSPSGNALALDNFSVAEISHPVAEFPGLGVSDQNYSNSAPNAPLNPSTVSVTGGSLPHTNLQPILAVTFIIAMQGIFPTRN